MSPHILVFSFYNPGRINPICAITSQLVDCGCKVTCYGEASTKGAILKTGADYRDYFSSLSAQLKDYPFPDDFFRNYRNKNGLGSIPIQLCRLQEALLYLDSLLEEVRSLKPDLIFYDPAMPEAVVTSEKLKVPRVSLITTSGPGVFGDKRFARYMGASWPEIMYSEYGVKVLEQYKQKFGINLMDHGLPWQFYSKTLNLVSVIEEMSIPLSATDGHFVFSVVGPVKKIHLGPCINAQSRVNGNFSSPQAQTKKQDYQNSNDTLIEEKDQYAEHEEGIIIRGDEKFPLELIHDAIDSGKQICYFALGTVITGMLWNGAKSMKCGGAPSGKEFFTRIVKNLVVALEKKEDIVVILNTGVQKDVCTCLPQNLPKWWIVCPKSPQVELLKYTDVFVTHGGAGSTNEAIVSGVPTVILPGFGDQLSNGETLVKAGAGIMNWDPANAYEEATSEKIHDAILNCLSNPMYKQNAQRLAELCSRNGGPARAAEELINLCE